MIGKLQKRLSWSVLTLAGLTVTLDWLLPSSVTLFFDELILFGCVYVMKRLHNWT